MAVEFEASELPATLTGELDASKTQFTIGGGLIECGGTTHSGGMTEVGETLALSPSYSECKMFGLSGVTATTSGCEIVWGIEGALDVACTGGASIKFKDSFGICQVSIPAQTGVSGVSYQNSEAKAEPTVTAQTSLNTLTATVTGNIFCPVSSKTYTNGKLVEKVRFQAKDEGNAEAVALWIQKPKILCAAKPAGNPLTCPVGEAYEGGIAGVLKKNAVFESIAGAIGSVTCNAATFTGENFTTAGKGSVAIAYNEGAACGSTIAALVNPKVVLEENKVFAGSEFIYIRPTPFQGRMWLKTVPPAVARLDLEGEGLTCSYRHMGSSVNVLNPVEAEAAPMEVRLRARWLQEAGGVQCPTQMRSESVFKLEQAGGGDLWIAGQ